MNLAVDVISDVICPWCYIGKKRFEKAIAALGGQPKVRVHWRTFQLNPAMPKEGISRKEYRTRKFGSWERSLELDSKVIAVGETEGIQFAFDRIERTPNTVDAHRLIWLAEQQGCQDAVVEALFRAYFTEGLDIGNRQILIDLASRTGIEHHVAETVLNGDDGMDAFKEAGELSRQHRVDDLELVKVHGPPKLIGEGKEFPFIVVSPQCPAGQSWEPIQLTALLDEVIKTQKADQDRIYVTGLSMGGFATWELAAFTPHRFAAIAPICGGGEPYWTRRFKHLPTWAFHGAKDMGVPVERSQEMIDALTKSGGTPKLTIYPEAEHDSWTETYNNPEFYEWLLAQKREGSKE